MYQDKIEAYFNEHKTALTNDIMRLVLIPSVGSTPAPGAPYGEPCKAVLLEALALADEMGFATTNYDGYVLAVDVNQEEKLLDILAHLDVVPAPPEDWTVTQPFVPVVKDGKLYGRGSADDKGPAVAALYALKAVRDLGVPLKGNVRLILGTDEERGSSDLDYYYKQEKEAPMSFTPDASFPVINVEKGSLSTQINADFPVETALPRLVSMQAGHTTNVIPDKGSLQLEGLSVEEITPYTTKVAQRTGVQFALSSEGAQTIVQARGVGGHAAEPPHGNNALTALLDLVATLPLADSEGARKVKGLAELFPHGDWHGKSAGVAMQDEISGHLTISLNIFTMDESSFSATFDSRCSLNATEENMSAVLKGNCEAHGLVFVAKPMKPSHHVSGDSAFVKTLLSCYEQYTGLTGECLAIGGGTYVHSLKNGVAFGASMPGTENNMHGADEFAVVEDLLTAAKIFTQAIIDLCS